MSEKNRKGPFILIGKFIETNPWLSFFSALIVLGNTSVAMEAIMGLDSPTLKLYSSLAFGLIFVPIIILIKTNLFTYRAESSDYGMELLTKWVDDNEVAYFVILLLIDSFITFLFKEFIINLVISVAGG